MTVSSESKMPRRQSAINSTDIERVLRAAKHAGAAYAEVRADGSVHVFFERAEALPPGEETEGNKPASHGVEWTFSAPSKALRRAGDH
ncbi:hypothetical protein [Bradyrhizobium sp. Leo121]|uniref:hypothetical protein n=1 Tax=Bradyrhizobium sp. Leo121 TaxID=1571195 RepID=UPI001028CA93|nr:hypothetical protein [Bradyrhizobium sp. Leo121]RZN30462.1 hypothetical protein CWO90_20205 [Bradyrhizobium sp. Leo121]